MENNNMRGVFFNENDIKNIIETYIDWADIVENQVFCAENIMNDNTPIGTSIIVGADGIKCKNGSNTLKLIVSSGIYELPIKVTTPNDEINIRFDKTIPIPGTYGQMQNGELDILTNEEKEFKNAVDSQLGDRDDEFSAAFRVDNIRTIGERGLVLLEKIKNEIKSDSILSNDNVTPSQLISVFIEVTDKYIKSCESIEKLTDRHNKLLVDYNNTYEENSKSTKKMARELDLINKKIDTYKQIKEFCKATIDAAITPVLKMNIDQ